MKYSQYTYFKGSQKDIELTFSYIIKARERHLEILDALIETSKAMKEYKMQGHTTKALQKPLTDKFGTFKGKEWEQGELTEKDVPNVVIRFDNRYDLAYYVITDRSKDASNLENKLRKEIVKEETSFMHPCISTFRNYASISDISLATGRERIPDYEAFQGRRDYIAESIKGFEKSITKIAEFKKLYNQIGEVLTKIDELPQHYALLSTQE